MDIIFLERRPRNKLLQDITKQNTPFRANLETSKDSELQGSDRFGPPMATNDQ